MEIPGDQETPISAAFREQTGQQVGVALGSKHSTGRRFALARLIGDFLVTEETERLLPAASAKTQRQELQRAFAQEFLCPSSDLEAFLEDKPVTDDAIEDDAAYFDVSPLPVRTELVNKHRLDQAHPCVTTEQAHCSVRSEALNP